MNDSGHAFRLVLWREPVEEPSLFGAAAGAEGLCRRGGVITNVFKEEKSAAEVLHYRRASSPQGLHCHRGFIATGASSPQGLHYHRGRGNVERFIGEAKCGAGLRHLPCGQEQFPAGRSKRIASGLGLGWFGIGMVWDWDANLQLAEADAAAGLTVWLAV